MEEALLRDHSENFCLINYGSSPAIVMGISGKKEELVNIEKATFYNIPLIKRFSGGGTVVIDHNTLFVTFIFSKNSHSFPAYPEPIMRWSEDFYRPIFTHCDFRLRENDYVLGDKKMGGNAQYLKKERWLHHTSFLWDYNPNYMDCLLHPKKTPSYRANRDHHQFICKLSEHYPELQTLVVAIKERLQALYQVTTLPADHFFLKILLLGVRQVFFRNRLSSFLLKIIYIISVCIFLFVNNSNLNLISLSSFAW